MTVKELAAKANRRAATPATVGDRCQAYYLRVLIDARREIDYQIAKHQTAMAWNQTRSNADYARGFRRMIRKEEQDRRILDRMICNLLRRFPRHVPPLFQGEVVLPPSWKAMRGPGGSAGVSCRGSKEVSVVGLGS